MHILVTGAAQGLGLNLVTEAASRGYFVYAAVRATSNIMALNDIAEQYAGHVNIMTMDVTDQCQVNSCVNEIGQLDAVINNAAISLGNSETIETLDLDLVRQVLEVNLLGAMQVVQATLPLLKKRDNSVIINISSEAGTIINAYPTNYPYAISKTALNMFSERLRAYLLEHKIRVYAIHPGWMRTGMGGAEAPADPRIIASGTLNIIEDKVRITSKISFIDATGRPMPL